MKTVDDGTLKEIDDQVDSETKKVDYVEWTVRMLVLGMLWAQYEKLGKPLAGLSALSALKISRDDVMGRRKLAGALAKVEDIGEVLPFNQRQRAILDASLLNAGVNLKQLGEKTKLQIKKVLVDSQMASMHPTEIESRLRAAFHGVDRDWRKVAVTESAGMAVNGYLASQEEGQKVVVQSAVDCCAWCRSMLHGKIFTVLHDAPDPENTDLWETALWPGKSNIGRSRHRNARGGIKRDASQLWMPCCPLHVSCFNPNETVWTPEGQKKIGSISAGEYVIGHSGKARKVLQVHRSFYAGELFSINSGMASPTFNHPVFVYGMGWVEAKELKKGDRVLSAQPVVLEPDNEKFPATSGKKFFLRNVISFFVGCSVPSSPMNLDSTLKPRDRDIDIVFPNGEEGSGINVIRLEKPMKHGFAKSHSVVFLNSLSSFLCFAGGSFSSFRRFVSHFYLMKSLLLRHLRPSNRAGIAPAPPGQVLRLESVVKSESRYTKRLRQKFDAFSGNMATMSRADVESDNHILPLYHTVDVESIERKEYCGVVVNLTVEHDETYLVGEMALLVHNCRCRPVAYDPKFFEIGADGYLVLKKVWSNKP